MCNTFLRFYLNFKLKFLTFPFNTGTTNHAKCLRIWFLRFFLSSILTLPFNTGMTSRAEMLAHRMVRITSGVTPGMTHGTIVVLEVALILSSVMRMVLLE